MDRPPVLIVDGTIGGKCGDVTGRAAGQRMIRVIEVRLLPPKHHLLKSEHEHEKWERYKPTDNTMHILRGHQ
jgi:hypothetical protein